MVQPIKDTFLYFAYGSNLLKKRIRINNPSAEFLGIGRLDNYRLEFIRYSKFWGGPTATLVPTANAHVWGVIWRLKDEDKEALDKAKGVEIKKYYVRYVDVTTPYMGPFRCRAFTQKENPLPRGDNDKIPVEQWPSWTYLEILIRGAIEHGLPDYYLQNLKKLKVNGEEAYLRTARLLDLYATEQPCQCKVPGRIPRKPLKLDLTKRK
ncbi:unnamed protein product [Chilo suppressalis]|uniref:gamma-glutamylcyclotransferase n=1 Tax=Chilo suppressalis TaxID=168631 RepID=A0ABN8B724_CHISP|nr:hypothetical protein evm_004211 [Chilo suppressalis]CAH0405260.1 unnamed protein product [Chilo suppressalis]